MDLDGEAGAPQAEGAPLEEGLIPGADCILQRLRTPNEPQGDRCSASSSGRGRNFDNEGFKNMGAIEVKEGHDSAKKEV